MSARGSWKRFFRSTSGQSLIALSFDLLSLFAGGVLALFAPLFGAAPWLLALYPPVLTVRGNLSGVFSGNLTTMLHLGLILPRLRGNTEFYQGLKHAVFFLSFANALLVGLVSFALNLLLGRASPEQLLIFAAIPTVSCVVANQVSIPLTTMAGSIAYRRGLDPDIIVYPILSSVNDILVTLCFVAVSYLGISGANSYLLAALFLAAAGYSAYLAARNRGERLFVETVREGVTVVSLIGVVSSANGLILASLADNLRRRPGIIVLYPALIDGLGDVGSVVGSLTTTGLALGYIRSLGEEVRTGLRYILQVEASALLIHALLGLVSYLIVRTSSWEASLPFLVGVALLSNLSTFLVVSLFALLVAYLAYRRGLNPDNIVIPAITSVSDAAATLSLFPIIALLEAAGV